MSQQLEFPASKVHSIELRSDGEYVKRGKFWVVCIGDGEHYLGCSLIAANVDTFYVSCEHITPDVPLPDYVVPMERDE